MASKLKKTKHPRPSKTPKPPKSPKTPNMGKKSLVSKQKKVGTKRTMSSVVGGPVKAGARQGGVTRSKRSRQK